MPYSQVDRDELTLRDHLARDRTVLANERTLLAYVRTAIALAAAGGTLLALFPANFPLRVVGITLVAGGIAVVLFGSWRFTIIARHLRQIGAANGGPRSAGDRPADQVEQTGDDA